MGGGWHGAMTPHETHKFCSCFCAAVLVGAKGWEESGQTAIFCLLLLCLRVRSVVRRESAGSTAFLPRAAVCQSECVCKVDGTQMEVRVTSNILMGLRDAIIRTENLRVHLVSFKGGCVERKEGESGIQFALAPKLVLMR